MIILSSNFNSHTITYLCIYTDEFKRALLEQIGIKIPRKNSHTSKFGNTDLGGSDEDSLSSASNFSDSSDDSQVQKKSSGSVVSFSTPKRKSKTPCSILKLSNLALRSFSPVSAYQDDDEMPTKIEWDKVIG